ncbi:helix-turn-helix transcriptional regulator [Aurantiacibacter sp. MUD61]|uniref:helix-turn-helix transcriptional regulator n=1 Tax=Aurantiacibacter sp. MUD61 TaxID=3009083 RepID=UPI0022F0E653|nr:AlpA family transcriptional regulator [Aurantiacibacter sp. MUD61]
MTTFLRLPTVLERVPYSRSTVYAMIAEGRFPKPVKLGGPEGRAVAWDAAEIEEWTEARLAERESA